MNKEDLLEVLRKIRSLSESHDRDSAVHSLGRIHEITQCKIAELERLAQTVVEMGYNLGGVED